jgi:hypothetical protein
VQFGKAKLIGFLMRKSFVQTSLLLCLLSIIGIGASSSVFSSWPTHPGEGLYYPLASRDVLQAGTSEEPVTIEGKVRVENWELANRDLEKAPAIELKPGRRYHLEHRFEGGAKYAAFDKVGATRSRLGGNWRNVFNWSQNQPEDELRASDYGPSYKCLITIWGFDDADPKLQGQSIEVPFTGSRTSKRREHGQNLTVFTFEFRKDTMSATVNLYRLP